MQPAPQHRTVAVPGFIDSHAHLPPIDQIEVLGTAPVAFRPASSLSHPVDMALNGPGAVEGHIHRVDSAWVTCMSGTGGCGRVLARRGGLGSDSVGHCDR
jgi:hypothetical protein